MATSKRELPSSVTTGWINLVGLAAAVLSLVWVTVVPGMPVIWAALVIILAYALPIILLEQVFGKVAFRASTGLTLKAGPTYDLRRSLVKTLGVLAMIGAVVMVHLLFRFYPVSSLVAPLTVMLRILPILLFGIFVYVFWVDARMQSPKDGYWQIGAWLTRQSDAIEVAGMTNFALGWVVKGFFLPIMFYYLCQNVGRLAPVEVWFEGDLIMVTRRMMLLAIILELAIVCTGYTLTLRLFDAHIRSVNPLVWGWVVTLVCYEPFNQVTTGKIINRYVGEPWYQTALEYPYLIGPWCIAMLISFAVWVWATCSFGVRWSNLTNRGVVTCGPYRFMKHPDYFAKSVFFWLTAMPFLAEATLFAKITAVIALLVTNLIYFARARAEEVHMSEDPDYVRYALAMNERSILRGLVQFVPTLAYRPPSTARQMKDTGIATPAE